MADGGFGPSEYLGIRLTGKCKNGTRQGRDAKLANRTHPHNLRKENYMASRFLVTGVQLSMIKALHLSNPQDITTTIEEIFEKQYVGDTHNEISEDVLVIKEGKLPNFVK